MNWTHSSRTVALGVLIAVALATAGTVGAVEISGFDSAEDSAQVGEEVTVEAELTELYGDEVPDDGWNLSAQTELQDADWSIIVRDAADDEVARTDQSGQIVNQTIEREANAVTVEVSITGTVPELSEFSYEEKSVEEAVAMDLAQLTEGGDRVELEGGTHTIHRFNEESQEARETIEAASESAEGNSGAESDLDDAITFYNNGEFEKAIESAEDAESTAESDAQTQQLLLIGGAVVVVLAVLGGGIYYWRQSQGPDNKLQ